MIAEQIIGIAIESISKLAENEKLKGTLFGTYSDGTPRSIPDCIGGETMSPVQKRKFEKKMKKKEKKKKYAKLKL